MLTGPFPQFLKKRNYYIFRVEHNVHVFVYGMNIRAADEPDCELYPNEVMIIPKVALDTTNSRRNCLRIIIKLMGIATRNIYGLRMITPVPHVKEEKYEFRTMHGYVEFAQIVRRLEFMMYICDMENSGLIK
jgi:hypothetical protein